MHLAADAMDEPRESERVDSSVVYESIEFCRVRLPTLLMCGRLLHENPPEPAVALAKHAEFQGVGLRAHLNGSILLTELMWQL